MMHSPRIVKWARIAATLMVAIPAVGIGAVTLWQAAMGNGGLDRLFHLVSGLALLILFCEFAVTIWRSHLVSRALLSGVGGFLASLATWITVELLGPFALLPLGVLIAAWAIMITSAGQGRALERGEPARQPDSAPCEVPSASKRV